MKNKPDYIAYKTLSYLDLETYLTNLNLKIQDKYIYYGYFLTDLMSCGLRFQELYNLSFMIGNTRDTYTFKTQKGSDIRQLSKTLFTPYYINRVETNAALYFNTSIFNFYNVFIRYSHPFKIFHKNKELSSHLFRHYTAKRLYNNGFTREEVQSFLGEKSILNSNNYIDSELVQKTICYH